MPPFSSNDGREVKFQNNDVSHAIYVQDPQTETQTKMQYTGSERINRVSIDRISTRANDAESAC